MRSLSILTIFAMSIALAGGQARAQTHGPGFYGAPLAYPRAPNSYCLQGRQWGYPGNCQFSSFAECRATASGTDAYCGINPQNASRSGATIHPATEQQRALHHSLGTSV